MAIFLLYKYVHVYQFFHLFVIIFFLNYDINCIIFCIYAFNTKNPLFLHITVFKVILRFQQKEYSKNLKKKYHEPLYKHHKKESEKKSMNYIFQVGIDFGQTRCIVTLIDRVLEENLIPRIDMAEPFKGYKKLHYLSKEYGTQSIHCTGHC